LSIIGYLEGDVKIGPLRPSERAGESPPLPPPEAYAKRSINIFSQDGTALITNVKISSNGNLPRWALPGTYVVEIARTGMDRARGLRKRS